MSLELHLGQIANTTPNHPLNALRRVGVVKDLTQLPRLVGVLLDGLTDPAATDWLPYLASYAVPMVGDVVAVLSVPPDNIVLGAIAGLSSPVGRHYYEERYLPPTSVQPSTITGLSGFLTTTITTGWASQFDSSGVWSCPFDGIWTATLSVGFSTWPGSSTGLAVYISRGTDVTNAAARIATNQGTPGDTQAAVTTSATKFIPVGGHLCFSTVQSSTTARTTVQDQRSYVAIRGYAVDRTNYTSLP